MSTRFSGILQILSINNASSPYNLTATFTDSRGLYGAADISADDGIVDASGNRFKVVGINSVSPLILSIVYDDTSSPTLPVIGTAIIGATSSLNLLEVTPDASSDLETISRNIDFAKNINLATGPAGSTGVQGTVGPTGPAGASGATGAIGPTGLQGADGTTGARGHTGFGMQGYTGPRGPTGLQGTIGFTGPRGNQGSQGVSGIQGPQGNTGAAGSTGPRGNIGQLGQTGLQGGQGAQGITGLIGATGKAGIDGQTGPAGSKGATGIVGGQGNTGTIGNQGSTGVKGSTGTQGNTGTQGPQGTTGARGSDGITGLIGPTGADGVTGAKGNTGAAGAFGNTGAQGTQGVTGLIGTQGATGASGSAGSRGATGLTGSEGQTGEQGPTGLTGSIGNQGYTGLVGATGSAGATGTKGATGAQGLQGMRGMTGLQGEFGETGLTGETGAQGSAGQQGQTGLQGVAGNTGAQGNLGQTGAQGIKGDTGVEGPTGQQGFTGISIPGFTGVDGPTGAIGAAGQTGLQGTTGEAGPAGTTGLRGQQGDRGITGSIGPTGNAGPAGATGSQGIAGSIGVTGSPGITGLRGQTGQRGPTGPYAPGPQGATGLEGPTGARGLTGSIGQQGTTGRGGETGSRGVTGPIGEKGSTGITGETGPTGSTGGAGIPGIQGNTGLPGTTGNSGATGVPGLTGPSGATGVAGTTGAQGATGGQGTTGSQGIQGVTGVSGDTGRPGATGLPGQSVTGLPGATGPYGVTGLIGATGASIQGMTGVQGIVGSTGVQGITGTIGNTGPQGWTGPAGGPQGATGPYVTGPFGYTGVQGATGVQGITGVIGQTGVQGTTGLSSLAGTNYLLPYFLGTLDPAVGIENSVGDTLSSSTRSSPTSWGSSNTSNITVALNTSTPLRATSSYLTSGSGAGATAGSLFIESPLFAIDLMDVGKAVFTSFDISGNTTLNNWDVVICRYNSSNILQERIPLQTAALSNCTNTPSSQLPTGTTTFKGFFVTGTTSTDKYALRWRRLSGTDQVNLDSLFIGITPVQPTTSVVTDWFSFTPSFTNFPSPLSSTGWYRRVGNTIEISIRAVASGAATGTIFFNTPTGLSIDDTKVTTSSATNSLLGSASAIRPAVNRYTGNAYRTSATQIQFGGGSASNDLWTTAAPFIGWQSGDVLEINVRYPVLQFGTAGTVSLADRALSDYAFNSGTWDTDDLTTFGNGLIGGTIGGTLTANRTKRVQFNTAIQPTDTFLVLLSNNRIAWIPAQMAVINSSRVLSALDSTGLVASGIAVNTVTGSTNQLDVQIGRYQAFANDDLPVTDWTSGYWCVVKISSGVVGYPISPSNITLIDSVDNYSGNTKLGFMQYAGNTAYNGGNLTTITGGAGFSLTRAVLIPYQMSNGTWRLKFNVDYAQTSSVTGDITFTGVTFSGVTSCYCLGYTAGNVTANWSAARTTSGSGALIFRLGSASSLLAVSGDVELTAKPTWAY